MKRMIEFWALVENHNLHYGDIVVIDWRKHDKGFANSDVVALCREGDIFWVESATNEEVEELINYYNQ